MDENPSGKEKLPVLICPSDEDPIGNLFLPYNAVANLSYSINMDVFAAPFYNGDRYVLKGTGWVGQGPSRDPLAGNLDRVSRPSEVVMFVDGGISKAIDPPPGFKRMAFLSAWGPTLSHYTRSGWLPDLRHGSKGGLVSVYVDGHAQYLRPIEWTTDPTSGQQYPSRYSPDPRMTPHKVAYKNDDSRRR